MSKTKHVDWFVDHGPSISHINNTVKVFDSLKDAQAYVQTQMPHRSYWRIVRAETPRHVAAVVETLQLHSANYDNAEEGL